MTSRTYSPRQAFAWLSVGLFRTAFAVIAGVLLFSISGLNSFAQEKERQVSFDIPAGDAAKALKQFSAQSGQQLLYSNEDLAGVTTNEVKGRLGIQDALNRLLENTPLASSRDERNGAVAVGRKAVPNANRAIAKSSDRPERPADKTEDGVVKLDTFEVFGRKTLNMDIKRSREDAQPYVIFERAKIEQSGATTLGEFLKTRLTMNTVGQDYNQGASSNGNMSQINLRGLGEDQTLILIDGHRAASTITTGGTNAPYQTDLNGIPIGAIERVEILPTTSSGIYGGSATGGVVNIILRRDYQGAELKVTYDNTFRTDTAQRRLDLSIGLNLEDGKTNILFAASYSDANALLLGDRRFAQRGIARILGNNPSFLLNASSPPYGATTNIRSTDGSNLVLKNKITLNSPITSIPVGYGGVASDNGAALVSNAGRYNLDLAPSAQNLGARSSLLNNPTIKSINATIRRQFLSNLQVFVDIGAASNDGHFYTSNFFTQGLSLPATALANPFGQAIKVTFPTQSGDRVFRTSSDTRRVVSGVIAKLPGGWMSEVDYTWSMALFDYIGASTLSGAQTAAIASGAVDVMRDTSMYPIDLNAYANPPFSSSIIKSTLRDMTWRFSGPLVALPAGEANLASFLEHRTEEFGDAFTYPLPALSVYYPNRSQSVNSIYLETNVPLLSKTQDLPGIEELSLQLSGRWDSYKLHGATGLVIVPTGSAIPPFTSSQDEVNSINPTIGLRYKPRDDVILRASYSSGFRPPSVSQLTPDSPGSVGSVTDPRRGNETIVAQGIFGGNPKLRPESSKSWSMGIVAAPTFARGVRVSIDYTRIEKTEAISTLSAQQIVNNEAVVPGRVTRGSVLAGDPFGVGAITFIDATSVNLSRALVEAYDLAFSYDLKDPAKGGFEIYSAATWETHYKTQLIPSSPFVEGVGTGSLNPLKLKANAGLTWTMGRWTLGWTSTYFDSYLVSATPTIVKNQGGSGRVSSQLYHDFFAAYRFGPGLMANSEIQLGIRNIFNRAPSFDASNGTAYYSPFGDPRLSSYYLSLKKAF